MTIINPDSIRMQVDIGDGGVVEHYYSQDGIAYLALVGMCINTCLSALSGRCPSMTVKQGQRGVAATVPAEGQEIQQAYLNGETGSKPPCLELAEAMGKGTVELSFEDGEIRRVYLINADSAM